MATKEVDLTFSEQGPDLSILKDVLLRQKVRPFIAESKLIEGIHEYPTEEEIQCHIDFIQKPSICVLDLELFVNIYQPGAILREKDGCNVVVGNHTPPPGGMNIFYELEDLLGNIGRLTPYEAHCKYETLHPFTDGNGRSGRALWAWHMIRIGASVPKEFLRLFYYQSLDSYRG